MPSRKPKNKIACASSTEHRGRVLRGSDRSAEYGLAQTAAAYEKEERPSQAPGERATMLDLRLEVRQPAAVFPDRNCS